MQQIRYFTADDGARIAWSEQGAGIPVLALAGLTRTGADFDYLAPWLTGVRLIRMDCRGRGESAFTGAETYTAGREGRDALNLLDHLGIERAAVIGTSRGGMIGMHLAEVAHERLRGLCLVDIGPELAPGGLRRIFDYLGHNPAAKTFEDMAARLPRAMRGFDNVPPERWFAEVTRQYVERDGRLRFTYDPALREAFLGQFRRDPVPTGWSGFDAAQGLPLALIRGANSDLLSPATAAEMRRRRPDMIFAEVPDRAHVPFLDEPEALAGVRAWLDLLRR
ncbi:alpha/beta fold hydrolase [Paenirhodobacter enshiensis]|uniref:Hydrolase n=1 Tax=Paenirhodobacter enshiensis TaxID=1105367 RepID=A0A086XZJ7_9RHOB|nr:alpha/beta hydrolase [Paenirhodobacter enshiensis]KFI27447.1 hydrolase [Paenirhodobacter enshiensis]